MNKTKNIAIILGDPNLKDAVKPEGKFDEDDFDTVQRLKNALGELNDYSFSYFNNHATLESDLKAKKTRKEIYLAFNLCDEGFMNDPRREADIPRMLIKLGINYTGAGLRCMETCYNKWFTINKVKRSKPDISVPHTILVKQENLENQLKNIRGFRFPAIVKPNRGDGSFGITQASVVNSYDELELRLKRIISEKDSDILIQEFLPGDDLTFGIIGNSHRDFTSLPITKEDFSCLDSHPDFPRICGYEAKWHPESSYWNIKPVVADLPKETGEKIVSDSKFLFTELDCKDYARFDWRLDNRGIPALLEVNPNPGWCYDGHLARAAEFAGISYSKMLEKILKSAERRLKLE